MLKTSDLIVYPSRATVADALDALHAHFGAVPEGATPFLNALSYYATRKGIDFAVIASHAANECSLFTSLRFKNQKDGFGIAVYGDGSPGSSFATYDDAAFYAVAEYALKLFLPIIDEEVARANTINPTKWKRVWNLVMGNGFPWIKTVSQMNTKFGDDDCWWMCDEHGPEAIVEKSKVLFPSVPDQQTGETDMEFDRSLVGRSYGSLTQPKAWVTLHNTGNTVDRWAEHDFFAGGGGDQAVLVTFVVDEVGAVQLTPMYVRGRHAGNETGNNTSIAIEMTARRDVFAKVEENTARLLAMIYDRDPRIDWTGAEGFTFHPTRTTDHRGWAGANPACPAVLIDRHGANDVDFMLGYAEKFRSAKPVPVPKAVAHPVGGETDGKGATKVVNGTLWLWVNKMFFMERDVQAYEYANIASRKGPKYKGGKNIRINYLVSGDGADGKPELFGTTRLGWRIRLRDLI